MNAHDHTDGPAHAYRTGPGLSPERFQLAKELAGAAAMSTDFTSDSAAAGWVIGLVDDAYRAVDEARDNDTLHDSRDACNDPEQMLSSVVAAPRDAAWLLVQQLAAWRAVDWEVLLGEGWQPDPDQRQKPGWGSVHGPVVRCMTAPADPGDLAEMMLRQLAERVVRLAAERRKDELDDTEYDEGDDE